jgi:hypothetical protein
MTMSNAQFQTFQTIWDVADAFSSIIVRHSEPSVQIFSARLWEWVQQRFHSASLAPNLV